MRDEDKEKARQIAQDIFRPWAYQCSISVNAAQAMSREAAEKGIEYATKRGDVVHECPMDFCLAPTRVDAEHLAKCHALLRELRKVVGCGIFGIPQEEATKYIGLITDLIPPESKTSAEK